MSRWDSLWVNASVATMVPARGPYGLIDDGAVGIADGRIAWVGPGSELPDRADALASRVHDAGGGLVTPGLIDCHTHLVFGGDRSDEFEARLRGASYEEIAREGGGIVSTVRATRETTEAELFRSAAHRLRDLLREGVTAVEVKSGYGLEAETELRMLRVARRLGDAFPVTVQTTFLGAHAVPPEFEGRREAYLREVTEVMLPEAADAGLVDAVDAFCEAIAFDADECADVFRSAGERGIPVRLHADQLSDAGGGALAARFGARTADHLEHVSDEGIRALADAGTVAVLLPGAWLFLGGGRRPPVEALRGAGVPMALATDANPGTSPVTSLLLVASLGCTAFGLTPEEALAGITRHAARALGMARERGTVEEGKRADLALFDVRRPAELAYWIGGDLCRAVVREGEVEWRSGEGDDGPAA